MFSLKIIAVTFGLMLAAYAVAGEGEDRGRGNEPPPREGGQGGGGGGGTLSAEQVQLVKTILAKYDANALTAEKAQAIHEEFRKAGLRGGPTTNDAVKAAGFNPEKLRDLAPPPGQGQGQRQGQGQEGGRDQQGREGRQGGGDRQGPGGREPRGQGQSQYSVEQAISDRAQLCTIAFDGLAFLTGDLGGNTFLPPGKVADFCGFQYMRDVDTNQLGHNTSFVPRAANNMLHVLTDEQKALLISLGKEQEKMLTEFAYKRFPLIKAFWRQLQGDIPKGCDALNREAVMKYTAEIFELDGTLSYRRAEVLGGIVRALNDQQKEYLSKLAFNNSATWPELQDQVDRKGMSKTAHVAVMTYASEMFSWYKGNVEADVYFCPERHATYFGSFYMKDIPAMGNPNYSISTSLTGDSGEAFLATLNESQRKLVTGLVDQQRADLNEMVKTRREIATELRRFMKEATVDKAKVMALSRRYGELDGEISYFYAMAFSEVAKTLTADQKKTLLKLRNLDEKYTCKGAYLFSQPIEMPQIPSTDFLFGKSTGAKPPAATGAMAPTAPAAPAPAAGANGFALRSPEVIDGGNLPKEFTGDGASATLPLEWSGAPAGTKAFAVIMHHIPPDGATKYYWILYNIPAETQKLPKNVTGVGTLGTNSVNKRLEYAPPHSKGPGAKTYIYTVYALSAPVKIDGEAATVTRDVMLAAMKGLILGSAEMKVVYTRQISGTGQDAQGGGQPERPERPRE